MTAVVVASESEALADEILDVMGSDVFRVFTSTDVIGVEVRGGWLPLRIGRWRLSIHDSAMRTTHTYQVGGAVKNVIAIAAGMCEGLGLGTNGTRDAPLSGLVG